MLYPPKLLRPAVIDGVAVRMQENDQARCQLLQEVLSATLDKCMSKFRIKSPATNYIVSQMGASGTEFLLNRPLQRAMFELARTSGSTLPLFVEMTRVQTVEDYRPGKSLTPLVLKKLCNGYRHLDQQLKKTEEGDERVRPPNHGSSSSRINILRKNFRKEQGAWRGLVLVANLIEQWPELVVSSFRVVDKRNEDISTSERMIHALSYSEGESVSDYTD
ncbi:hypothetical protein PHMEG_0005494 [Phytophthora megakarya]|uniref:Uncharacterized protein n=1 Tax=Phytophthora megakarya TaxID=4795 RepID=A0A225WR83_9STRA|nr:hypothetical protein PHMEG_0005494 [Phytophthora megakarya]